MAINIDKLNSYYLLTSRESFRKKIIDAIEDYENLTGVDLSKTQFLSYMIDIISIIGADNANSLTITRKENYLVTASMPSSVANWASYLGYSKRKATPSNVTIAVEIPLNDFNQSVNFKFPKHYRFYANDIVFSIPYSILCEYNNNTGDFNATIQTDTDLINIETVIENNVAKFVIYALQYEIKEIDERVPTHLQLYEPFKFDVTYEDYFYKMDLYLKDNENSNFEKWDYIPNYFVMAIGERGFSTVLSNENTVTVLFGNGVFGRQPKPNSIIKGYLYLTKGYEGNITVGAINQCDALYYVKNGVTTRITINCTNIESSIGGRDEETMNETKINAINKFKARRRFVSEDDYQNINTIMDEEIPFPITYSVLKRSDLKMNEINTYIILVKEKLMYKSANILSTDKADNLLPEIPVYIPIPTNSIKKSKPYIGSENILPYFTVTSIEDSTPVNWVCPFGMQIESKTFAYFYYYVKDVDVSPNITFSDTKNYPNLVLRNLNIQTDNNYNNITFRLDYQNNGNLNLNIFRFELFLKNKSANSFTYTAMMDNTQTSVSVTLPINEIKYGNTEIYITIRDMSNLYIVRKCQNNYYLKQDMKNFMFSNCKYNNSTNEITIYDIPVIKEDYWNSLTVQEKRQLESDILNKLSSEVYFGKYRMITNSINIKFAKTDGILHTYYYNHSTIEDVIDITNIPPSNPLSGDRYIVGQEPVGVFSDHINDIAFYENNQWWFTNAKPGDIVYVASQGKRYTFSGNANRWIFPKFNLPLNIKVFVKVTKSIYDNNSIIKSVKKTIMYILGSNSFRINGEVKRSIMYEAIQGLSTIGISYCEIKIPEVNIEFNYDINDLTKDQLIDYCPIYLWTDEDHISVIVSR